MMNFLSDPIQLDPISLIHSTLVDLYRCLAQPDPIAGTNTEDF